MARDFELHRREALDAAFARLLHGRLARAEAALVDAELTAEQRVHETRKRFKESRAVVRLYRYAIDDAAAMQRGFRDAGRQLAAWRDATATVAAVEELPDDVRRELGRRTLRRLTTLVTRRRDELYAGEAELARVVEETIASCAKLRRRIRKLDVDADGAPLARGFAKTLADARRALRDADETQDEDAVHELRKRVKDHWYHLQLFAAAWPEVLGARADALHALSELLGRHHDLAVVRELATAAETELGGADETARIAALLAARQSALAAELRPLVLRLFAAKPRALAREVLAVRDVWDAE